MQKTIKSGRLDAFAMTKEDFLYVYRKEKGGLRRDAELGDVARWRPSPRTKPASSPAAR